LDIYEGCGKPIEWLIVNDPLAMFVTETGTLNHVVFWRAWATGKSDARLWPQHRAGLDTGQMRFNICSARKTAFSFPRRCLH
jgi:hypothetical protein